MARGQSTGVVTVVLAALALLVSSCGFAEHPREAKRGNLPEGEEVVRADIPRPQVPPPSVSITLPAVAAPPVELAAPPETVAAPPLVSLADLPPKCASMLELSSVASRVFTNNVRVELPALRELNSGVLDSVEKVIDSFASDRPEAGPFVSGITSARQQVRAADSRGAVFAPLSNLLDRHADFVDDVFSNATAECSLPKDPSMFRPSATVKKWIAEND
jgi:hypothetical protein